MHRGLQKVAVLVSFLAVPGVALAVAPCDRAESRPRKELRQLSGAEWQAFVNAVKALKAEMRTTPSGKVSTYDQLVEVHRAWSPETHGYAKYLPWHRRYLVEVERHLQRVANNPSIRIPYWDTGRDGRAPASSSVFWAMYLGNDGHSTTGCVVNGSFAGWRVTYPTPRCLRRDFDGGSHLSPWETTEDIASILRDSDSYNEFRHLLESGPAGSVHVGIGGDMATAYSPNDPLYWLAQANWDRLWDEWQQASGTNFSQYNGPNRGGSQARTTDILAPYTQRVSQVFSTESFGYCYQD